MKIFKIFVPFIAYFNKQNKINKITVNFSRILCKIFFFKKLW